MNHELIRTETVEEAARTAGQYILDLATEALGSSVRFSLAVSGGRTPSAMFSAIVEMSSRLDNWDVWQVDERIAPEGDPARNITQVRESLGLRGATVHAMPVNADDLERASGEYARDLPDAVDVIHLGLGADGHTASLVPHDPALLAPGLVAVTNPYQGHQRMTLTYSSLSRARCVVWLVTGADKRGALASLVTNDRSIPASHVEAGRSVIFADAAALGE